MTWKEYVGGLSLTQRDALLYSLLEYHLDDLGIDSDVRFDEGEDPEYQGTYTANADIFWAATGNSLIPPRGPIGPHLCNRADGVKGHYCISRSLDGIYYDAYDINTGWGCFGTVFKLE